MEQLKNKHKGFVSYIIGKGRSLEYLTNDYFSENGIIITINESVIKIKELNPLLKVYSMQKDGYHNRSCVYPDCYNCNISTTDPSPYTLLVHKEYSEKCFEDYPDRIVFDNKLLGLTKIGFSALSAIKLSQLMGCDKIVFLCFDAHNGDIRGMYKRKIKQSGEYGNVNYKVQIDIQKRFLLKIPLSHKYITPTSNGA